MRLSYQGLMDTKRTKITAKITYYHPASHYRIPVIVMSDGEALDYQSAILLDYRIERATPKEVELLKQWQAAMSPVF